MNKNICKKNVVTKQGIVMLLFAAIFFGTYCFPCFSAVTKPISRTNARVSELLIKAMQARDNNNLDRAELYWKQAKALRPSIARPSWLKPAPVKEFDADIERTRLLISVASMPYELAKPILEEMVKNNPTDLTLRHIYLEKARMANDGSQITRHSSFIHKDEGLSWPFYKIFLALIFIVLVIWQIYKLIKNS